jgi:ABC-type glutathione transport system ATPase component
MASPVLEVRGLKKHFPVRSRLLGVGGTAVKAVDGVDFAIHQGETLGLIGESGCGKTTTSKLILLQETPTAGTIAFDGRDIATLAGAELMSYRRAVQVVFQDPFSSLSPRMRVRDIIAEPLEIHSRLRPEAIRERVDAVLQLVGLPPDVASLFPHEFSGGQRQRIAIARALAPEPEILVCDEPVSALDVSVQKQILDLLAHLKARLGLSCLFISHDLGVIHRISDRVLVMKDGVVVESGPVSDVFTNPQHAYTRTLLSAIPQLDFKGNAIYI